MVTEQDYERLSDYIDNTLPAAERQQLEARLLAEPALRAELDALRQTVALVRGLPTLKAPRDFALTPAMVGRTEPALARVPKRRSQPFWSSAAFSALSAAAAFVLIAAATILTGLDGIGGQVPTTSSIALQPTDSAPIITDLLASPTAMPAPLTANQAAPMSLTPETAGASVMAGAAVEVPATSVAEAQQETTENFAAEPPQATAAPADAAIMGGFAAQTPTPDVQGNLASMASAPAESTGTTDGDFSATGGEAVPTQPPPAARQDATPTTADSAVMQSEAPPAAPGFTGAALPPPPTETLSPTRTKAPTPTALPTVTPPLMTMTQAPPPPPQGTPVALLPSAESGPVPIPPAQAASLPRNLLALILLGAGIGLGLLAVLTTFVRRRSR